MRTKAICDARKVSHEAPRTCCTHFFPRLSNQGSGEGVSRPRQTRFQHVSRADIRFDGAMRSCYTGTQVVAVGRSWPSFVTPINWPCPLLPPLWYTSPPPIFSVDFSSSKRNFVPGPRTMNTRAWLCNEINRRGSEFKRGIWVESSMFLNVIW